MILKRSVFSAQKRMTKRRRKKCYAKRQTIFNVHRTAFHNSIIISGQERKDKWGNYVLIRICTIGDLQTADAIYHENCYKRFSLTFAPSKMKA